MISGKGDDGFFWRAVLVNDSFTGLEKFYPNVFLLRGLHLLGFDFTFLYFFNLVMQSTILCLILLKLKSTMSSGVSSIAVFMWLTTSVDLLFSTVYLMRDVYIIYFLVLLYGVREKAWPSIKYTLAIVLFRPFAAIIALVIYAQKVFLLRATVVVFILWLALYSGDNVMTLVKVVILPNTLYTGQEFEVQDIVDARQERALEGRSEISQSLAFRGLLSPILDIVRPLVYTNIEPEYLTRNGLTNVTTVRRTYDPYVMWQNLIILFNCFYIASLFLALRKALFDKRKEMRHMALIYFLGSMIISLTSGQGRHLLMISWIEPILIGSILSKNDTLSVAAFGSLLTVLSIIVSGVFVL